ncbi:FSH1 domain-containing protein [Meloidogyne graminicola]|uniref:FSH1 domain-containing protein n=1 Tax=Meloidogyne graminicola TaxID=189291 RepID=A0A8S9ZGE9_9BILA|nr:FSH1 domain-containing protein [Meloidogyne graminicola]
MTEERKQLKILCFHGYRQNAEIFKKKSGALRKLLRSQAKFGKLYFLAVLKILEFISAPFPINSMIREFKEGDEDDEEKKEEEGRAWWFSNREQRSFSSREVCTIADGFEESVEYTLEYINNQGPFDGFLGFSQGSSFIHLLLASNPSLNVRFVILFSGFKSLSSVHTQLTTVKISIKSLHIWGLNDEIVLPKNSELLAEESFKEAQICTHSGRHCVPPLREIRGRLEEFLDQF